MPGLLGATAAYAVLVPVAETAEGLSLLYELRSPALHHHSGEVCFPGGRMEPGRRRSSAPCGNVEELASPRGHPAAGRADFLHLRSEALMHPVLGQVAPAALERLRLNPAEVRQTFLVSLDWLAAHPPEVYRYPRAGGSRAIPLCPGAGAAGLPVDTGQAEVPVYDGLPYPLWGLTARITRHVVQRATEGAE